MADNAQGYREIPPEDRAKAQRFFEPAAAKAGAGQFDFAITYYLDGLRLDPEAVDAHKALRDVSLKRKASGGKAMGMWDKMSVKKSNDDRENMLNAERLLAFDPGERSYMADLMTHAVKAGCYETALWMGVELLMANRQHPKPDVKFYLVLRDSYKSMQQWKLATDATQFAFDMRPNDMDMARELKDLSALETMKKGNFEQGDFRKSMRDVEKQQLLIDSDREIRTIDAMTRQILDAEKEHKADPLETGKLLRYVDLMAKTEDTEYENRAIDVLTEAYNRTKQYRFRLSLLRIQMKQIDRMERSMRAEVAGKKEDKQLLEDYRSFVREKYERELAIYTEAADEYPTDMTLKYEAAVRLIRLGRHDEAIPALQVVRNDPKYKIEGSILLGQAFLNAGFADEAVDTFAHASEDYQIRNDPKSLQIFYWWGRALEAKNPADVPQALKCYSQVFQWNAMYLDVSQRIKKLRAGPTPPGP